MEFPYLQKLQAKYGKAGYVTMAINGMPQGDDKAAKFMSNKQYDFLSLRVPKEGWAEELYQVRGYPTNFLLDGDGRVIAHPDVRDAESLRSMGLLVESLLSRLEPKQDTSAAAR